MELAQPIYLLLLLLLVPYFVWRLRTRHRETALRMSDTFAYKTAPRSWRVCISWLPELCRLLAFVLLVIALARPQSHNVWDHQETEGIDIMMAMDISVSMLSQDVRPNRIEVAKDVAAEFITSRPHDHIGLTVFAGEAFTQCPLTTDHTHQSVAEYQYRFGSAWSHRARYSHRYGNGECRIATERLTG